MNEKPLHAQVAEALGCRAKRGVHHGESWSCTCARVGYGHHPHNQDGIDGAPGEGWYIQDYDTDWAATGPLIEKYRLQVHPRGDGDWQAQSECRIGGPPVLYIPGPTPLIAVCNLILALSVAGKLKAVDVSAEQA